MNERTLELIHTEIDGRISATEREELRALLDADPKLREIRSELQKLAQSFGKIDPLDPPAGLRRRILDAIRPPAKRAGLAGWFPAWPMPTALRYGGAVAFGAAAAAVALQLGGAGQGTPGMDVTGLAGTMARYQPPGSAGDIGAIQLNLNELYGSITGHLGEGLVILDIDLTTTRPVAIVADYDSGALRFSGYAQTDDSPMSVTNSDHQIIVNHEGPQHYAVFFEGDAKDSVEINFRFVADGQQLHEETLKVPLVD